MIGVFTGILIAAIILVIILAALDLGINLFIAWIKDIFNIPDKPPKPQKASWISKVFDWFLNITDDIP
jgi:hypothetical protein